MKYTIKGDQKYLTGSSIHNDATDCEMILWAENEALRRRLSECEDVLRFYADKEHWFCDRYSTGMGYAVFTVVHASDEEPIGGECYYGGKRARQYFKSAEGEG
jgi:hypothetical protein